MRLEKKKRFSWANSWKMKQPKMNLHIGGDKTWPFYTQNLSLNALYINNKII